ncbi:MAG: B12-binding domain-containing radical SAM protein, partial [bacterium]|nr:B12-binding domain-containing radical SAM protein [bacterium]
MRVALVNTNRMQPPIGPIGLDYIAEALNAAGHQVELLDLCWAEDTDSAIAGFFSSAEYGLVGVTLRNTDDCAYTSQQSFLGDFAEFTKAIRGHT